MVQNFDAETVWNLVMELKRMLLPHVGGVCGSPDPVVALRTQSTPIHVTEQSCEPSAWEPNPMLRIPGLTGDQQTAVAHQFEHPVSHLPARDTHRIAQCLPSREAG